MEYDVLKDMVRTITKNKVKQIEVFGSGGKDASRLNQLYEGISKGHYISDEEAAQDLFGKDASDGAYQQLRRKLLRQLINTSFFIDVNQPLFNERSKAFYNCYRDYAAACILTARGAGKAATYLLSQVLEQGIKYEFTELNAEVTRMLRMRYSRTLGDLAKHEAMTILHNQYEEKRRLEIDAFNHYEYIIHHYVGGRSVSKEIYEYAKEHFPRLLEQSKIVDSVYCYYYTYCVGIMQFLACNDSKSALSVCQEALNLLKLKKDVVSKGVVLSIIVQKIAVLTQMRTFDESVIEECDTYIVEGEANWFTARIAQFPFFISSKEYGKALKIYEDTISHPQFKLRSGINMEMWKLYGGYIYLLSILGKLDKEGWEGSKEFKLSRFENDFEILNKEKIGMNIPVMLLSVMVNLLERRDQDLGRSVESLDKYRQRYLQNDTNKRSASFMKILFALSDYQYNPDGARKKIKNELKVLSEEPLEMTGQSYAIEVIPYEDLWQMLSEKMKIVL